MIAFEKFLEENPDMGERPCRGATAASLSPARIFAKPNDQIGIGGVKTRDICRSLPRRPWRP